MNVTVCMIRVFFRFLVSGLSNMMGAANAEIRNDRLGNETMDGNHTQGMHNRTMKVNRCNML